MRITRAYGATQEIEENPIVSPYFVIFHIISSFMRMKSKKISLLTQYYYLLPRFVELPPPLTVKLKAAENNSNPADIINCEWDSILKQHYFQLVCDKDISNPRPKSGITPIVPGPRHAVRHHYNVSRGVSQLWRVPCQLRGTRGRWGLALEKVPSEGS